MSEHTTTKTPACWAWQTEPLQPALCTCVGCTRYRAEAAATDRVSRLRHLSSRDRNQEEYQ